MPWRKELYIGLARDGQPDNIIILRPRKKTLVFEPKLPRTEEIDNRIEEAGIESLEYGTRWGRYRLSLDREMIEQQRDLLKELVGLAYEERST